MRWSPLGGDDESYIGLMIGNRRRQKAVQDARARVRSLKSELARVRIQREETHAELQALRAERRTDADIWEASEAHHPPSRPEFTGVPGVAPSSSGSGSAATAHSAAPAAEAAATSPGSAGPVAPAAATASGRGDPAAVEAEPPRVKQRLS